MQHPSLGGELLPLNNRRLLRPRRPANPLTQALPTHRTRLNPARTSRQSTIPSRTSSSEPTPHPSNTSIQAKAGTKKKTHTVRLIRALLTESSALLGLGLARRARARVGGVRVLGGFAQELALFRSGWSQFETGPHDKVSSRSFFCGRSGNGWVRVARGS